MLDYENQMFLEILQDDGLTISAKGLSLENVFINILKVYCDPGNLVVVLGTNDNDEQYFLEELKKQSVTKLPQVINSQLLSEDRNATYLDGGVLFISGRILVVDLLKARVPLELVTGILVYRAHNILNSYQEAFALRLYRQKNKTGFIKAFSNSALAFMSGFAQVERIMKTLFVNKLFLWPRFHSVVNNCLCQHKPEVIELHAKLTPKMIKIQTALLDVINFLVKDLKRLNKSLDLEELTVENVVAKKFHKHLQYQLDPVWNQLSFKTKQLIADMKTLRHILMCLTNLDAVTFYAKLNTFRTVEYAMKSSGWIMLDIVEDIFKYARSRIYNDKDEIAPEPNPKWTALFEILSEIHRNFSKDTNPEEVHKVLVLTQDSGTCKQLKNVLTVGSEEYLAGEVAKKLQNISNIVMNKVLDVDIEKSDLDDNKQNVSLDEENEITDAEEELESYVLTLSQNVLTQNANVDQSHSTSQTYYEDCTQMENLDLSTLSTCAPVLVIQSIKKNGDPMSLCRTLNELKPKYIVMYAADISAVRQLEVFQNNNPFIDMKLYFLIYGGSVEEQAYLTSLRREKEAFDLLINTKSTMVIPVEQDGKSEILFQTVESENQRSTRKGDVQEIETPRVIVDMREFRSELPSLLHKRNIDIEPVTLIIGDYILSPEICVERKSISDLIGSLNSGRLYNQAVAMSRYYAKPILLIEFDENKPFTLQGNYYISKDMKNIDVTTKLQLLTMHFPKLRIVWSPSPSATAQLFEELKHGRTQPDGLKCAQVGGFDDDENKVMSETYNSGIQDFVMKLPGVHSKNIRTILNKGVSMDHLILMTQEEITALLGNKNDAQLFYDALHKKLKVANEAGSNITGKTGSKTKQRKLFIKKSTK